MANRGGGSFGVREDGSEVDFMVRCKKLGLGFFEKEVDDESILISKASDTLLLHPCTKGGGCCGCIASRHEIKEKESLSTLAVSAPIH